ncbi:alpha/beta hydrolase [Microbispora corallina]|uniref:alpha/beta hydrolase n=1 Tax=Microbispora corallina TaxID=83302 RepID=UPI001EF30165|nr:alpha/beta hydrolase [Microbispora corallina]
MKRVVGVVAGAAMVVAGLVGPEGAHAAPGRETLAWGPCRPAGAAASAGATAAPSAGAALAAVTRVSGALGAVIGPPAAASSVRRAPVHTPGRAAVQCATLRVPLDYAEPEGRQITLSLNRVRGTASQRDDHLGALLVNPGGPGGSGLDLAKYVAAMLPSEVAARYDVIGFAPRGVGPSEPAISCVDPARFYAPPRPDAVPKTVDDEAALVSRARQYAEGCGSRWSWFLPYLTTENSARDMDAIRAALGEDKISYLGYSYGTYLGAVYATLFPQRVRRLVLDSNVDPDGVWYDANISQDYSFDRRHRDFLDWVARNDDAYRLGATEQAVHDAWYSMRSRLRVKPGGGLVGPSELDDIYSAGGYSNALWPALGAAFSAYVRKGDTAALVKLFHSQAEIKKTEENSYAVYLGVECRDARWPRSWDRWHVDTLKVNAEAPFMAWPNAVYNAPCAFWPVPGLTPVRVGAVSLPPILLIQAEHDAATPYAGAVHLRRRFPTASLVTEGGGNHGVSLSGNSCVDRYLSAYLRDASLLPQRRTSARGMRRGDAWCPALPDPKPQAPAAARRAR